MVSQLDVTPLCHPVVPYPHGTSVWRALCLSSITTLLSYDQTIHFLLSLCRMRNESDCEHKWTNEQVGERFKLTRKRKLWLWTRDGYRPRWWCWPCFYFQYKNILLFGMHVLLNLLAVLRASTFFSLQHFFPLILVFRNGKAKDAVPIAVIIACRRFKFFASSFPHILVCERKSDNVLNYDCKPFQVVCLLSGSLSNALKKALCLSWKLEWDHHSETFDLRLQFTLFHFKFHFVSFYLVHLNIFFFICASN